MCYLNETSQHTVRKYAPYPPLDECWEHRKQPATKGPGLKLQGEEAGKMAQWVKVLAFRSHSQSSVPRTDMVEKKTSSQKLSSDLYTHMVACAHSLAHDNVNKCNTKGLFKVKGLSRGLDSKCSAPSLRSGCITRCYQRSGQLSAFLCAGPR